LSGSAAWSQATPNPVVTNPTATQTITQPPGTGINLVGTLGVGQFTDGTAAIDAHNGFAFFGNNNPMDSIALNPNGAVGINTGMAGATNWLSIAGGLNVDANDDAFGSNWWTYNTTSGITFGMSSGEGIGSARVDGSPNQNGLDFFTSYQKRLSLTPTGDLGLGTTTPASWSAVNVAGSGTNLQLFGAGSSRLIVNSTTTSELHMINGAASADQHNHRLSAYPNGLVLDQPSDNYGTSTLNMVWNNNGFVGIGTATPSATLEVNGIIKADAGLIFPNGIQTSAYLGGSALTSAANGNVGIGTTAAGSAFSVNGGISIGASFAGSAAPANGAIFQGKVGIGTNTPGTDLSILPSPPLPTTPILEVSGDIAFTQGIPGQTSTPNPGGQLIFSDQTVQSTAWNGTAFGGDYAESIDVDGERASYEPGDIISIDEDKDGKFRKTTQAYSRLIAGVFSTKPGLVGRRTTADRPNKAAEVPMAMLGVVPTKVCAENGPINRGDLLVSSSTPGYAMRGTDSTRLTGAVIGKAMATMESGCGLIEVLIVLQ